MTHPAIFLQGEIYAALIANNDLANLIGTGKVYDDVPQGATPPYITFGKSTHLDWSTDTEGGMEHSVELVAWSRENGRKQTLLIQQAIIDIVTNLAPSPVDHHLINITHEESSIEVHDKHRAFRGNSLFRAITEPVT